MGLISDAEKITASADVRELIESSGQRATLFRTTSGERLYGSDDSEFSEVCEFSLEITWSPSKYITNNADGLACVLPELDVRVEDRVHIDGCDYRVQTVVPQPLFGVITHTVIELVKLHGS